MGSPDPEAVKTVAWIGNDDEWLAMEVSETFLACAPETLAETLGPLIANESTLQNAPQRALTHEDAPSAIVLEHAWHPVDDDLGIVATAYTCVDGSLQMILGIARGRRARVEESAQRMAAHFLRTLRLGPTRRTIAARTVELPAYAGAIRIDVPEGWTHYTREGPDFRVHYLLQIGEATSAQAMLYLGDHPRGAPADHTRAPLFGQEVGWRDRSDERSVAVEHVGPAPRGIGTRLMHVVLRAANAAALGELQAMLGGATVAPVAPATE